MNENVLLLYVVSGSQQADSAPHPASLTPPPILLPCYRLQKEDAFLLYLVANKLTQHSGRLRQLFSQMDDDKNSMVDRKEFQKAIGVGGRKEFRKAIGVVMMMTMIGVRGEGGKGGGREGGREGGGEDLGVAGGVGGEHRVGRGWGGD